MQRDSNKFQIDFEAIVYSVDPAMEFPGFKCLGEYEKRLYNLSVDDGRVFFKQATISINYQTIWIQSHRRPT